MMKLKLIRLAVLCAIVVFGASAHAATLPSTTNTVITKPVSSFTHIQQTHTLRCGYTLNPPFIQQDGGGQLSGIFYDLTMEIARQNQWQVEWTPRDLHGRGVDELLRGDYDAFCGGVAQSGSFVQTLAYSSPVVLSLVGIFVKADDYNFDQDWTTMNNALETVAFENDDIAGAVQAKYFSKAKVTTTPGASQAALLLVDGLVAEPVWLGDKFGPDYAGLRNIAPPGVLGVMGYPYMFDKTETLLPGMFNASLKVLAPQNFVAGLVTKYGGTAKGLGAAPAPQ